MHLDGVLLSTVPYHREMKPASQLPLTAPSSKSSAAILMIAALACCLIGGMAAMAHGYQIGEYHLSTPSEFAWFWAGMLLLILPIVSLIARRKTSRAARTALLILYGIVSFAPKLLRNPAGPLYHDEFAHWLDTDEILRTGKLFQPNPILPIAARYPGLQAATAALVHATGLTIWQTATILILICHVMLVLGIVAVAEIFVSNRTAALAAVLYGVNSSFLYFDTQFAYESMAITLVVWTLVAYMHAIGADSGRNRTASCVMTVILAVGTIVTHHLSTVSLLTIMAVIALGLSMPISRRKIRWAHAARTAWLLTLAAALLTVFWFIVAAPGTLAYLSPYVGQGFSQLMQDAQGSGSARQIFSASLSPWWEQKSAYLVTIFAFGTAAGGYLLIRSRIRAGVLHPGQWRVLFLSFTVLGIVYFPSLLFILSSAGAEGARRSWAFTWIELAVVMALSVAWLLDQARRPRSVWTRISLRAGLGTAMAISMVGGTAAGLDATYRFTGPFLYGSVTRDVTPELIAASTWFESRYGDGNSIVTDRYTGIVFASYGLQNVPLVYASLPIWDLYLANSATTIPPSLLSELKAYNYDYLVVDRRMAYYIPELGTYFNPGEPQFLVSPTGESVFFGRLQKFDTIPWMEKVFQSNNYSIYRLNLPAVNYAYGSKPFEKLGKLVVLP